MIEKNYHPFRVQRLVLHRAVDSVRTFAFGSLFVMKLTSCALLLLSLLPISGWTTNVDEDQLGAWYMMFVSKDFEDSKFGFQGDLQHRNWDYGEDLEQLLVRGGLTYRPDSLPGKYTLGLAHITSGAFGPSSATNKEIRVYQEALIPHSVGQKVFLNHRLRFEQRDVDGQDFRTRLRYALFANIPLNKAELTQGAWYLALYNELFINGQQDIGEGREVDYYDRNRTYGALGYKFSPSGQIQAGYMQQHSRAVNKGQFQLSVHLSF
jgi:hypothetical protein